MVRTRFAPSPTGFLHIGGVRTALFNWLYARRHGGQFVLRIDDTDRQRNLDAALQPILHGFRWLGIDWDEGAEVGGDHGPYYQSQKTERYQQAVDTLLANGSAYRDYAMTEELQQEREEAQQRKARFLYSRRFMAESDADAQRFEAEGRSRVVRLMMPREGTCAFTDRIRADVEVEWAGEQDHVIQRADGSCLYHLANVVDDHDMKISHVIRAEEHLSNTPRQIFIAQALGYELPEYAHLPFVAEPGSKNKLSKRKLDRYLKNPDFAKLNDHGRSIARALGMSFEAETFNPVIVDFYEQIGFLPDAVLNYLLLLGWSLDDRTEWFDREQMIASFSLERVNKAAASFDPNKLMAFQEHHMLELEPARRARLAMAFLIRAGWIEASDEERHFDRVRQIVEAAGDRIKVAGDILNYRWCFVADDVLDHDEKAFEKRLRKPDEASRLLRAFSLRLEKVESFEAEALEQELQRFVEEEQIKIGQIIHALRVAVTGQAVGFGIYETLVVLGQESCRARIEHALARI